MNTMQANNPDVHSFDEVMDSLYGAPGTEQRNQFRREAYAYCVGTIISDARRQAHVTQQELARRVGTTKSYISKVENGVITPSVGLFYRFINAIGMRVEVVNPLC